MKHFNGHMPCVVDVETTGTEPGFHDLIQIGIIPLDDNLKVSKVNRHLELKLKPKYGNVDPKAMSVHGIQDMIDGVDNDDAICYFLEWYDRLDNPLNRKLAPIASNYVFDRDFIREWLGQETFEAKFHYHYRDTQAVALFLNDRAAYFNEPYPFPGVGLPELAGHFGIENLKAHDAVQDSITTQGVYERLMSMFIPSVTRESGTWQEPSQRWYEMAKFVKDGEAWVRSIPESENGIVRTQEHWWICSPTGSIQLPDSLNKEDILRYFL